MSRIAAEATLEALDFPLLVQALAGWAQTPMGTKRLEEMEPLEDPQEIEERHNNLEQRVKGLRSQNQQLQKRLSELSLESM